MSSSRSEAVRRNLGYFMDVVGPKTGPVKRWDGAARNAHDWDDLRKDPDLWSRNGNCLVHLYAKGQSRRGPSFKLPFRDLLANKCFPLIERFLVTDGLAPRTPRQLERWGTDPRRTVELYIPPPLGASKRQAYVYHLATRNFFAWVLRRSLVGEHLGHALVGLLYSMHEFRADVHDNVSDIMEYMDEEGYLDLINQPNYALAVLYFAESMKMEDLYIRAYAHCVGMGDQLSDCSEYQQTSMASKRLIERATADMTDRTEAAINMLKNFLDDELSESQLGIPAGARAHLERFRSFLLSFYTTRWGYYPPQEFEPCLLRSMRYDFETLYDFLVDETYSTSEGLPSVANGGICILQQVQMFDDHNNFEALAHPLPLLPQFQRRKVSRRMPWRIGQQKLRSDEKLLAHASLIRASNWMDATGQQDLVRAYRTFEEETVLSPYKADKQEKVSLVDARKVRWILVYAVYQVLRSVTEIPAEVSDFEEAPYNTAVSIKDLPPWIEMEEDMGNLLRRQTSLAMLSPGSVLWADSAGATNHTGKIEIKPDIDYFALTHSEAPSPVERNMPVRRNSASRSTPTLTHSRSVPRALTRSSTLRRSIRKLRPASIAPSTEPMPASRPMYHEILVQGYGNGLNNVSLGPQQGGLQREESLVPPPLNLRNNSTASNNSNSSTNSSMQSTGTDDTIESTLNTPTTITPLSTFSFPNEVKEETTPKPNRRDVVSMFLNPSRSNSTAIKRSASTIFRTGPESPTTATNYSDLNEDLTEQERSSLFGESPTRSPRRHSMHPSIVFEDDWTAMQAFMDDIPQSGATGYGGRDAWEQYADLGGLTELR